MIRTFFKAAGLVILMALLGGFLPATLGAYGPYWKRWSTAFLTNPLNPAYWWYDPLEQVAGRPGPPLPVATPADNPFPAAVLEDAADYAGAHSSDGLIVLYDGKVVLQRYWNDTGPDQLIAAHSMTKSLPAMLIGHAIAEGFIESVDIPAATFLREWDTAERRGITIRHLLNMTSGVEETYDFTPRSARMQRTMGLDIVKPNLEVGLSGPPGREFAHFNPNSQLLGVVVERATGRRFSEYLAEKIWQPLGNREAFMFVDRPGGMVHTDCCMWTALADWARVGEMLRLGGQFNGTDILPGGWVAAMTTASAAYPNYGMQLWLGRTHQQNRRYDPRIDTFANFHSEPFLAEDIFYLDGLGKQRVYILPTHKLVILRVGSGDSDWDDAWLPNHFVRALAAG
jgi:CubicO group peptidase (beta-lactamase class C family)